MSAYMDILHIIHLYENVDCGVGGGGNNVGRGEELHRFH